LLLHFPSVSDLDRQFEELERQKQIITLQRERIEERENERSKEARQANPDGANAAPRLSLHSEIGEPIMAMPTKKIYTQAVLGGKKKGK
tara:strand:- start:2281 stop:2547 length:267 start_codon:yes stop_codon:yes gene_type:complete